MYYTSVCVCEKVRHGNKLKATNCGTMAKAVKKEKRVKVDEFGGCTSTRSGWFRKP